MFDPKSFSQVSFKPESWNFSGAVVAVIAGLMTLFHRRHRR